MTQECIFCRIVAGRSHAGRVYEDELTLAFMNLRQANPGHVLVIPKAHLETIYDLDEVIAARLWQTAVHVSRAIRATYDPPGLTVWQSNGEAASQEIPHVHIHLFPRRFKDRLIGFYPQETPPAQPAAELDRLAEEIRQHMGAYRS